MTTRLEIRCTNEFHNILSIASEKLGITKTDIIINSVLEKLSKIDELKNMKYLFDAKQIKDMKKARDKIRLNNSMRYIIRNFYRNAFQLAQSYMLNRGDFPQNLINNSIDEINELYCEFPYQLKEELHEEMQSILKLRDKEFFIKRYKEYMQLKYGSDYIISNKTKSENDLIKRLIEKNGDIKK